MKIPAFDFSHVASARHGTVRDALRDQSGQGLVELALALTLLTVIMLGAAEFGRLAYAAIEVSDAARAGVAYGVQSATTASDTTGMQTAATNDASDLASWKGGGLTAVASQTCKCSSGNSVTCANASTLCLSPARVLTYVQVNTTATVDPLVYVPGMPRTYTLTGKAIMQVPQ
jgi:Flp pilus assembly protein TadG